MAERPQGQDGSAGVPTSGNNGGVTNNGNDGSGNDPWSAMAAALAQHQAQAVGGGSGVNLDVRRLSGLTSPIPDS